MTPAKCLEQAKHNRAVADVLLQGSPPTSRQWAITCIFYAALHYVNAHIIWRGGKPPSTHGQREHEIRESMRSVYSDYRWLKTRSEDARYMWVEPDEQTVKESRQRVNTIQEFVESSFGSRHHS